MGYGAQTASPRRVSATSPTCANSAVSPQRRTLVTVRDGAIRAVDGGSDEPASSRVSRGPVVQMPQLPEYEPRPVGLARTAHDVLRGLQPGPRRARSSPDERRRHDASGGGS